MKIGIYGGCFNPPHKEHYHFARLILEQKYVDKVIFVPTSNTYQKKDLIDFKDRVQMLTYLCQDDPKMSVSTCEVNGSSTYATLKKLQSIYPNDLLYFVMGTDNMKELSSWVQYQKLLDEFYFLISERKSYLFQNVIQKYPFHTNHFLLMKEKLEDLSSTYIRNQIQDGNLEAIQPYLHPKVYQYIKEKKLYQK